ncbi:kinesin-like protein KIN-10A [Rutidosis leptorrhynchoides]|uniref:kinesin-like protein KIN-10A n=1 Tax=Rutidosis leptorrhynchoides TaxID=125765 RepID=UPI003A9A6605
MAPHTPSAAVKSTQIGLTPSSSSCSKTKSSQLKTPNSKHRLNFNSNKPSPNPNSTVADHPVEVVGRIRNYPDRKDKPASSIVVQADGDSVRLRTDIGYRDFTLDGVSLSESEDLDVFYDKFVQSRINSVKLGGKCTIMMYGPTGSGKSHTMFGCAKQQQQGIVYKSLRDILGNNDDNEQGVGFVQVTVLEIYNEEIYDLLSTANSNNNGGGFSIGWSKASASKVKLEVMGKKAKNATFISGTEAGKISKEIQKVEKRRIIKSTFCNERSSRSHCMIILDVPTVGGRLMLVDMAGSENIEQAGQTGFEAKMQTAKINQGNIALKRVVESIANGDLHVPFRDSKLTMLLQDSFEDDKSKILMILCASPDPKEIHKTISTLEYGAKAKCIVRGPHTPIKADDFSSDVVMGSRIAAMDQFICKLQMENKIREKEKMEAHKQLVKKEEEIALLRARLEEAEKDNSEKVNEILRRELEKKIQECQKMADQVVEMERKKMEAKIVEQQEELEMLRRRLEEIESELTRSREEKGNCERNISSSSMELEGSGFAKKLMEMYAADEDPGMEKSMDLDKSLDMETSKHHKANNKSSIQAIFGYPLMENMKNVEEYEQDVYVPTSTSKAVLSTVFEDEEEEDDEIDDEVQKEVIEEKRIYSDSVVTNPPKSCFSFDIESLTAAENSNSECVGEDTASSRIERIQNIFTLCGNYRELSQHKPEIKETKIMSDSKENCIPTTLSCPDDKNKNNDDVELVVKWEDASSAYENGGKLIANLKLVNGATLADLRKLIEIYLAADNQDFTFLDPTGAPVAKEDEASMLASKLPTCNNGQTKRQHLAALRPANKVGSYRISLDNKHPFTSVENRLPFSSVENKLLFSSSENRLPFGSLENKLPSVSAESLSHHF